MESFDFVVIGAGSGGSAAASRLSESGKYSVLLIEPGGKTETFNHRLPLGVANLVRDRRYSWQMKTGPENALGGYEVFSPRGLGLGGSSAINGMIWSVGAAEGWDEWLRLGHEGWGWKDIQPVSRRVESFAEGKSGERGHDGPIHIEWQRPEALGKAFLASCEQAGFQAATDYNNGQAEGFSPLQTNTRNGWRWSAYTGYLKQAARRPNLVIRTGLYAHRLIMEGRQVTGVRCLFRDGEREGGVLDVRARREVILAAGAYHSPMLLERSGIGDPVILNKHGIKVLHANAHVGANLLDHMRHCICYRVNGALTVNDIATGFTGKARGAADFFLRRRGWLRTASMNAQLITRSGVDGNKADLKLQLNGVSNDFSRRGQLDYPYESQPGLSLLSFPIYPRSRGRIHITGDRPWDHPEIHTGFLEHEYDQAVTVEGLKLARRIGAQPAFSPFLVDETFPGVDVRSDQELLDYARGTGLTVYHPVGTCRMGGEGEGVVDRRLKVHGIDGLRIADASIMPTLPATNTNAPSIIIGERAAEWALQDSGR